MSSSVVEISNDHEQDDLSVEVVNQHQGAKISVEFNRHEEPVGQYDTDFRDRVGNFVNTYVPISYKTWSEVDTTFKDNIWNAILEQVKAKVFESSPSEGKNIRIHPLSIDEDPLTQVLGKRVKGLPGVGRLVSNRKYDAVLHSHIMHSDERNVKKGLEKMMDNIQKQLDVVLGCFKAQMMGGSSTPIQIPDSVHMSMSKKTPAPMRKEANKSSASLPATMSNACGPLLGEGDSTISTRIKPTSTRFWMKVSICVRKMFSAKLYKETPDAKTIQEVGIGDFLVWPKVLIRFEDPVR